MNWFIDLCGLNEINFYNSVFCQIFCQLLNIVNKEIISQNDKISASDVRYEVVILMSYFGWQLERNSSINSKVSYFYPNNYNS